MRRPALLCALCALSLLAAVAPAAAQSSSSSSSSGGQSALDTELRFNAIESQMRDLTGRIEELNHQIIDLKAQLDRLSSDVDLRFSQLQHPGAPAPSGAAPPQPAPPHGAGDMSQPPTRSGNLGTLSAPPPAAAKPAAPQQSAAAPAALPKEGSPQDQYNYAMGLLTQANYPAAEEAMRSFVARWPKDPLAGNAQYWLGETFYVRKDYANAATAFAQGYEKYPHGAKAPDDLLKLGMSLANLNQKTDACRAYARLRHDFPSAPAALKERLVAETRRAGC
jgi:tol-pal system protein YbgF